MPTTRRQLLASLAGAAVSAQSPKPPNILFVLSDDHSAPYLGCYGTQWIATPTLDKFAAEGVRFTRAFTAAPQCVPSRTALMTGRSPVAARMGRFSSPLPKDVPTAQEALRTKGYYTGICGRYFHLDGSVNPSQATAQAYEKNQMKTFKQRVDILDISNQVKAPEFFDRFLTEKPKDRPWFFWMNFNDPHHPWDPGDNVIDPAKVQVPIHLPDLPGVRADLARYGGEIQRADKSFADALAVLRKHNEEANTIVVFMGDNGMAFPHGKGSLFDPGLNVPLIARWPGKFKPAVTDKLISGEDLAATFMDIGGAVAPTGVSGKSFYPLLTGRPYTPREYIFAARLHHGNAAFTTETKASEFDLSRCVRSARYKLIYNLTPHMEYWPVDSSRDAGWQQILAAHKAGTLKPAHEQAYFRNPRPILELYDLDTDPGELRNLAGRAEYKDVQQTLMYALQEKQITDYDFAPPVLNEANRPPQPAAPKKQ